MGFRHNIEVVAVFRVPRAWWQLSRDIPADAGFLRDKVAQAQGHDKNDTAIDFIMGSRGVSWAIPGMTCYRREIGCPEAGLGYSPGVGNANKHSPSPPKTACVW
jgi:hypothetical protein